MMTPPGWSQAPLEDVAEVRLGRQRSPDKAYGDNLVPYLRAANVRWAGLDLSDVKSMQFSPEEVETFRLRRDDILVVEASGSRDEVGKSALWRDELPLVCLQNTLIRVRSRGVDPAFLRWHLHLDATTGGLGGASKGIGIHHIGAARLASWQVRVPPLNEQRRIVAKLDAIFDQARAAQARLARLPALVEKLKRSILAAAFRGNLTKDWRVAHAGVEPASTLLDRIRAERRRRWEEGLRAKGKNPSKATYEEPEAVDDDGLPELASGWTWASVDELASLFQYGSSAKTSESGAVPVLRMGNLVDGRLVLDNLKYLPANHDEFPELHLEPGDLLFNRTNSPELVGKTAVFEGVPAICSFASYLIRVRVEAIDPRWVSHYINSPAGRDWVRSVVAQQVGQANVNGTKLKALAVPVPPVEEIAAALRIVDESLATIRTLLQRASNALEAAVRAESAALSKAFRGELVPQDPTDEPASVLLDRIRAAHATESPRPARGRAQRRTSTTAAEPDTVHASDRRTINGQHDTSLDLVVAVFQADRRLTTAAIAEATDLNASAVKKALKSLVEAGQVRVDGTGRNTAYVWTA